jgi:hypothetical protein
VLDLPTYRLQTGKFIPEKCNIWRDCVDGMYDWVKEHIEEVRRARLPACGGGPAGARRRQPCAFAWR